MISRGLLVAALAVLPSILFSQTQKTTSGQSPQSQTSSSSGSAPNVSTLSAPTGYILSPNDQVGVEVFGEEDLRTYGRLNGEGTLSVPLLRSIHLAGRTLSQAAAKLTDLYGRDYLGNPKVNVVLVGYAKRGFTRGGQINHPG